jgi:hypothetical protein
VFLPLESSDNYFKGLLFLSGELPKLTLSSKGHAVKVLCLISPLFLLSFFEFFFFFLIFVHLFFVVSLFISLGFVELASIMA